MSSDNTKSNQKVNDNVIQKLVVWKEAETLVSPIISKYGLGQHATGPNVFSQTTKVTPVDQHIGHIMRVADWLLEP